MSGAGTVYRSTAPDPREWPPAVYWTPGESRELSAELLEAHGPPPTWLEPVTAKRARRKRNTSEG